MAGEAGNRTHRPRSTPEKLFFIFLPLIFTFVGGIVNPQDPVRSVRLEKLITLNYPIGSRTRYLLACSIVSQPHTP
jgi:hypothetical protein